jgi:hypothetical protein
MERADRLRSDTYEGLHVDIWQYSENQPGEFSIIIGDFGVHLRASEYHTAC